MHRYTFIFKNTGQSESQMYGIAIFEQATYATRSLMLARHGGCWATNPHTESARAWQIQWGGMLPCLGMGPEERQGAGQLARPCGPAREATQAMTSGNVSLSRAGNFVG